MKNKWFQIRKRHFDSKRTAGTFIFIVFIFVAPLSIFGQVQTNRTNAYSDLGDSINGITIHQEVIFKASPTRLYEVLLSSKEFSECTKKSFPNFTTMSANIDSSVGGAFSVFDGHIIGRILELVPSQRIVEAWRVVDWPAGVYSITRFEFKRQGKGTQLIFDHVGFPKGLKDHLSSGWQQHYWEALSKYLQ